MASFNEPDKILFAVAFNRRTKRGWRPGGVRYTKAPDAASAKAAIIRSEKCLLDIIAVGPAIGFFVEDNHGDKLSAS